MKYLKVIFLLPILLAGSQCTGRVKNPVLGIWEGRAWSNGRDNQIIMYLSFEIGSITADYTPSGGGKFYASYRFKDERTIETSLYPDHLVIELQPNEGMRFLAGAKGMRESVDVVYHCKFKKVVN